MRQTSRILFAATIVPLLIGCHRYYLRDPEPLTAEQVIELSQQGLPATDIIQRIRESRTVYDMNFEDALKLKEQGVDPKVIDYMLKSRERILYRRAYYDHYPYYYPYPYYPHFGFYYGPYYCW